MDKRRIIALLAALVAMAAILLGVRRCTERAPEQAAKAAPGPGPGQPSAPWERGADLDRSLAGVLQSGALTGDRDQIIAQLRARYGAHIHNRYIQMKMLEELIRYLQAQYPDRWREILLELVREAFPELHEEIAATLAHRLDYEQWMNEHRARLQGMSNEERQAALWEARNRIFGADAAEQIWAAEIKNRAVADALAAIDSHEGASIADKLSMYKETVEDIHQEGADTYLERHRHESMNRFIGLESVQRELSSMSAEDRAQSLREIRKGMGLDDAALARWDDLDRQRDARWEKGLAYMAERDALVAAYTGADLEARLDALRTRYFGAEATVIAREEESGMFRFQRPRRWGQN
jgi:hypothetical protein